MIRAIIIIALALAYPAAASATMRIGVQDDEALKYNTTTYLARADLIGSRSVRIMAPDNRWSWESDIYIAAACAAHDSHRFVFSTLTFYGDHPTAREVRAFAWQVVPRMADCVDAWSVINEPNGKTMHPTSPYWKVWNKVAPVVQKLDPTAKLVFGDVAPGRRWRLRRGAKPGQWLDRQLRHVKIEPRILGFHPYAKHRSPSHAPDAGWRAYDVKRIVKWSHRHHMTPWATEFGIFPRDPQGQLSQWLQLFRAAGVRRTFLYDTPSKAWNTQLTNAAITSIAGFGGKL